MTTTSTTTTTTTTSQIDSEHENNTSSSSSVVPPPALVPPEYLNAAEKEIYHHLVQELKPTSLDVRDISGGCGSTYAIEIVSHRFTGLTLVQQQKLVYVALRDMIKNWHGVRIQTSPP
ncbi:BolA-like protein 3 [Erysiphe neolycopersici]|uniref:BolA-like protein 3 n=1 Tax=Erysiphe neolycopersici TaxID=212602 RepID=A0A420I052_9PEZI|nr:BolA-like protein 3 [Erysiphe neolycopersici]